MTKFNAYVFTYNRKSMLDKTIEHLNDFSIRPMIIDDGSTYRTHHARYYRFEHGGKDGFWYLFNYAFVDSANKLDDIFLFMPDDFQDIDIERIKELHEQFKGKPYVYNIINDGRSGMWTGVMESKVDDNTLMCGMVDCGFFCNYQALRKIGFYVTETESTETESGVGKQLSQRFLKAKVPMYKPVKSLAYHGNHESVMHPELRKRNPLISI